MRLFCRQCLFGHSYCAMGIYHCSEAIFEECKQEYVQALNNAGYSLIESHLKYQNNNVNPEAENRRMKKNRNRYVTWFTPPWFIQVSTNIGREFLKIVEESYRETWLGRILNKNTVKVSYSVTRNLKSIITDNNKKILGSNERNTNQCNCQDCDKCPLHNNCVQRYIVYRTTASTNTTEKEYIGCTDNLKPRYMSHLNPIRLGGSKVSDSAWGVNLTPPP